MATKTRRRVPALTRTVVLDASTLPKRLRIAREDAGLSVEAIGERLGRSPQVVYNAEIGRRSLRPAEVEVWADACGVDLEWLRTGRARRDSNPQPSDPKAGGWASRAQQAQAA